MTDPNKPIAGTLTARLAVHFDDGDLIDVGQVYLPYAVRKEAMFTGFELAVDLNDVRMRFNRALYSSTEGEEGDE